MILQVVRESSGFGITISERQISEAILEFCTTLGIPVSLEGAAGWAALKILIEEGKISEHEKILLLSIGSGYKYLE